MPKGNTTKAHPQKKRMAKALAYKEATQRHIQ